MEKRWKVIVHFDVIVKHKQVTIECETEASALILFAAVCKLARHSEGILERISVWEDQTRLADWDHYRLNAYTANEYERLIDNATEQVHEI